MTYMKQTEFHYTWEKIKINCMYAGFMLLYLMQRHTCIGWLNIHMTTGVYVAIFEKVNSEYNLFNFTVFFASENHKIFCIIHLENNNKSALWLYSLLMFVHWNRKQKFHMKAFVKKPQVWVYRIFPDECVFINNIL